MQKSPLKIAANCGLGSILGSSNDGQVRKTWSLSLVERCAQNACLFFWNITKCIWTSGLWNMGWEFCTVSLLRFMALPNSEEARATARGVILAMLWSSGFSLWQEQMSTRTPRLPPKSAARFFLYPSKGPAWFQSWIWEVLDHFKWHTSPPPLKWSVSNFILPTYLITHFKFSDWEYRI